MKDFKIAGAIIIGAGLIALAIYFGLTQEPTTIVKETPQKLLKETVTPSSSVDEAKQEISPTPSQKPKITWTKSDLTAALSEKTGIPKDEIVFNVSSELDQGDKVLLRGTISRQGEASGAGFFAVVDSHGTQVTYTGQGVPKCSEVDPYGYPTSWADYCLNVENNPIRR